MMNYCSQLESFLQQQQHKPPRITPPPQSDTIEPIICPLIDYGLIGAAVVLAIPVGLMCLPLLLVFAPIGWLVHRWGS